MKRRAILIEASQVPEEDDLPGARLDVRNFKDFLISDLGGAWEDSEVKILSTPKWLTVQLELLLAKDFDFVFMTFSGHGCYVQNKSLEDTVLCLKDENVPIYRMNPGSPKSLFIIDACRKVITEEILLEHAVARMMKKSDLSRDRLPYRQLYDSYIEAAEKGTIRLYGSDLNESAHESKYTGGYFSASIIQSCKDWHDTNKSQIYSCFDSRAACADAARRTSERAYQHPVYEGGRRHRHFPMAVKP